MSEIVGKKKRKGKKSQKGKREREAITHARPFPECCICKLFTRHSEKKLTKLPRLLEDGY